MKPAIKFAALSVLVVIASGCHHKKAPILPKQIQAPVVTAPPPANTPALPQVPPPSSPHVSEAKPEPPPSKPNRRRRQKPKAAKPPSPTEQQPSNPPSTDSSAGSSAPPANSPIGQLSTSSDTGVQNRAEAVKLINSTEKGLDGITRSLNTDEQTTVTQIRAFLVKAREALEANDLDGAHTLATKARVLLDELTKE